MGKLIVTEFMTLDGVAQAPGGPEEDLEGGFAFGGWQAPLMELGDDDSMFDDAASMDALLLGRRTYDIFADYWPTAPEDIPFTGLLNRVPKYVASRTLAEPLEWNASTLLAGDLESSIREIKDRHAEVHVIGSLDLLQSLFNAGLVDELRLWQYPLVLGTGKRVFEAGAVPTAMRLSASKVFPNGTAFLTYQPVGTPTTGDMTTHEG